MHQKTDLLISDLLSLNNDGDCHIIHWNSYEVSKLDGIFSIPHLVEENADYLIRNKDNIQEENNSSKF